MKNTRLDEEGKKLALEFQVSDEILEIAYKHTFASRDVLHEAAEDEAKIIVKIIKEAFNKKLSERVEAGIILIIMDKILRIAIQYEDVTTSDIQGMAQAETMNIIAIIKNYL